MNSLGELYATLSEGQLKLLENGNRVYAVSRGYLPSVVPEGEGVSFMIVEGVIIGTYLKTVRFGQDVMHEAPVRAGRVAIDAALARAKAKFAE